MMVGRRGGSERTLVCHGDRQCLAAHDLGEDEQADDGDRKEGRPEPRPAPKRLAPLSASSAIGTQDEGLDDSRDRGESEHDWKQLRARHVRIMSVGKATSYERTTARRPTRLLARHLRR